KSENKPILLSIGYSACHWCHVMAHESFEDESVAAVMNELFVNVKVDREERPDLDQIYQMAHAMLTQRSGGWPLTMFLTPDQAPFFGGTYFPKASRYGLTGFADLLPRIAAAYREQGAAIAEQNARLKAALALTNPDAQDSSAALPVDAPGLAYAALSRSFDRVHGGFGGAPKFPHPFELEFCLRRYASRDDKSALEIATVTLARMAEGGIHDQLGGGFCRYSVEALLTADEWAVARRHWALDRPPNFGHATWHLRVGVPLTDVARELGIALEAAEARLELARAKLFAAREQRVHPGRDDKVLTSW